VDKEARREYDRKRYLEKYAKLHAKAVGRPINPNTVRSVPTQQQVPYLMAVKDSDGRESKIPVEDWNRRHSNLRPKGLAFGDGGEEKNAGSRLVARPGREGQVPEPGKLTRKHESFNPEGDWLIDKTLLQEFPKSVTHGEFYIASPQTKEDHARAVGSNHAEIDVYVSGGEPSYKESWNHVLPFADRLLLKIRDNKTGLIMRYYLRDVTTNGALVPAVYDRKAKKIVPLESSAK
jgi:hypothetical protein